MRGVFQAGGRDARRQAERRVVGHGQSLFIALDAQHADHGAEDLFAVDAHAGFGVDEQRGRHVEAVLAAARVAGQARAARGQPGAFGLGDFHIGQVLLELGLADHGADVGARGARVADLDVGHARLQGLDEGRVDSVGHDQAAGGGAALARGVEAALRRQFHGLVQVGVVEHDLRVLAAHFQLHLLAALHAGGGNAAAHAHRAGETDGRHVGVLDQGVADHAARTHDQVEHAGRNARAVDDVGQRPGAAGNEVGGLEHHAVAEGQGRCDLPGGNGDGEVPGRDQADHADGLARDLHADAGAHRRQGLARQAQAFAGEELEDLARARDFAHGFGPGLAFLARQQVAQLFLARQDLGANLVERVVARLDAGNAPGREGGRGGGDGGLQVIRAALGVLADHIAEVAGVDVGAVAGGGRPLAVDQIVVAGHVCSFTAPSAAPAGPAGARCPAAGGALQGAAQARASAVRRRRSHRRRASAPWRPESRPGGSHG
ncbi:hypothetical protein D3C78_969720 [compost metagenome]